MLCVIVFIVAFFLGGASYATIRPDPDPALTSETLLEVEALVQDWSDELLRRDNGQLGTIDFRTDQLRDLGLVSPDFYATPNSSEWEGNYDALAQSNPQPATAPTLDRCSG